jgi:hypothetical protein
MTTITHERLRADALRSWQADYDENIFRKIGQRAPEPTNVVLAIKLLHSSADSIQRAVHHQVRGVPLWQFKLLVRGGGMT